MDQKQAKLILLVSFIAVFCIFHIGRSRSLKVWNVIRSLPNEEDCINVPFEKLLNGPFTYHMPQDHPKLIKHIQRATLPPSIQAYNLSQPERIDPSQCNQPNIIMDILGEIKNGFFMECGAHDGEANSNSLVFERKYGWNGLLVEPNPKSYEELRLKRRKASTINACLSIQPYPKVESFRLESEISNVMKTNQKKDSKWRYADIQCVPLYSLLLAMNTTTIDYFSLDVEGSELDVLKTVPWDKVNIRTFSVEFNKIGAKACVEYMESIGYHSYAIGYYKGVYAVDYIFHRHDVIPVKPSKMKNKG